MCNLLSQAKQLLLTYSFSPVSKIQVFIAFTQCTQVPSQKLILIEGLCERGVIGGAKLHVLLASYLPLYLVATDSTHPYPSVLCSAGSSESKTFQLMTPCIVCQLIFF